MSAAPNRVLAFIDELTAELPAGESARLRRLAAGFLSAGRNLDPVIASALFARDRARTARAIARPAAATPRARAAACRRASAPAPRRAPDAPPRRAAAVRAAKAPLTTALPLAVHARLVQEGAADARLRTRAFADGVRHERARLAGMRAERERLRAELLRPGSSSTAASRALLAQQRATADARRAAWLAGVKLRCGRGLASC